MRAPSNDGDIFAIADRVSGDSQRTPAEAIANDLEEQARGERPGQSSVYSCPDCGGVLWEFDDQNLPHFACHIGHRYEADALVIAKSRVLDQALYEAVRGLREKSLLVRQLAAKSNPKSPTTGYLIEQADQAEEHARLIETRLLDGAGIAASVETTADLMADVVREIRRRPDG